MRLCNECKDGMPCTTCNNQVEENKEFEANINLIKRQVPNEYRHMLLYYKEQDDFFYALLKSFSYLNKFLFFK